MDCYHRYTTKGFKVQSEIERRLGIRTGTEKEQVGLGAKVKLLRQVFSLGGPFRYRCF
jgi:hypothetical protein